MYNFRYLRKGFSLRLVNFIGLTVLFVSLFFSVRYVRHELCYDRHHSKADRIARLSLQVEGEGMDVRIYGKMIHQILAQVPEIESFARFSNFYATDLEYKGRHFTKNENVLQVNREFFDVFDIGFIATEGGMFGRDQIFLSESYARYLAAESSEETLVGKEVRLNTEPFIVAGIFEDFPETSHFNAEVLMYRPAEMEWFGYLYLLLREGTDLKLLGDKITEAVVESGAFDEIYGDRPFRTFLMPLTDIHLHSHHIRELSNNGNVIYIWLVIGANVLLLLIVLFNFLLNMSLIMIDNEKRYMVNWILGSRHSWWLVRTAKRLNMDFGKSAKWVFLVQYAIVILVLVLTLGMGRQMNMVSRIQPGGDSVLVLSLSSDEMEKRMSIFKAELEKSPHVEGVTTVFLFPGNAVRDHATISVEGLDESVTMPMFVVGEDFIPFFDLELLAGEGFGEHGIEYEEEYNMLLWRLYDGSKSGRSEGYIINETALPLLGFDDPYEAVGKEVRLSHGTVDYIDHGTIIGVVKDFYYTGTLNATEPIIMMQRSNFQHYALVDLADRERGMEDVRKAWDEVYPDYVMPDYEFMNQVYDDIYQNERQAIKLMRIFALICFIITDLGLIVFMAYIVKRRRREIALRKVNGASVGDIMLMLNRHYMKYIMIAFAVAVPVSWFILDRWLQRFAYRITVGWTIFALAGLTVILISLASVSWRSFRAATANPLDGIREN